MENSGDIATICLLLCGTTWFVFQYLRERITKSALDNIPGPPSQSFWTGNLHQYFGRHSFEFHKEIAYNYGSVVKLHGALGRRLLYVYDPLALNHIFIKDQHYYGAAPTFTNSHLLMLGPGLSATIGERHRRQRTILKPAFSANHMRNILPIFRQTMDRLRLALTSQLSQGPQEIDIVHCTGRTSLELIGQGGLGFSFDPLLELKENEYGEAVMAVFPALQKFFIFRPLLPYVFKMGPAWFRRRLLQLTPFASVRRLQHLSDTMDRESTAIFENKKLALQKGDESVLQQVGKGKDIMSLLVKANNEADENDRLPDAEIIAQMSTLTLAATDTSSSTIARICLLLAQHPEIQEQLRQELMQPGNHDEYDDLQKLPLLDAVLKETLRVYPPANLQSRDRQRHHPSIDLASSGVDGTLIKEIPVQAGTEIMVGVLGCNTSKALWGDDATEWKPERWLKPLPNTVMDASIPGVYSHLMTFLAGKKSCIGFKFAELAIKTSVSMLVANFTFELTQKPIMWNMAGVTYPTLDKDSMKSELPLKMGLVKV